MPQCDEIKTLAEHQGYRLQIIPLAILKTGALESNPDFTIDGKQTIPPTRPSLVIRTTGTTGGPKSVVHTRRLFHRAFPSKPDDLILIHENLDWISGSVSVMMRVLGGAAGEVLPTNPGPAAIWERLRRGGVTSLTDHSWFWEGLARHFRLHIAVLPDEKEREEYVRAARSLRWAFVVGTPPPPSLLAFWEGTFGAKLQVGYVATELGAVALSTSATEPYVEVCQHRYSLFSCPCDLTWRLLRVPSEDLSPESLPSCHRAITASCSSRHRTCSPSKEPS